MVKFWEGPKTKDLNQHHRMGFKLTGWTDQLTLVDDSFMRPINILLL